MQDFTLHKVIIYYRDKFPRYWPIARFHMLFFYPVLVPIDPEYVRILLGNTGRYTSIDVYNFIK